MSISTTIKSIQDIMRKDVGVDGDAQRIGQLVWMFFLKIYDDKETEYELLDCVNNQLFPTLKNLQPAGDDKRGFVIRGVFEDAYNHMKSVYLMRQVINKIGAGIDFNKAQDRHLFGDLYEQISRDLQNAGNAGEYYTPRPVTQFMVDPPGVKSYNKTKPMLTEEFDAEKAWWVGVERSGRVETGFAWKVSASDIKARNYNNLDIKNPHSPDAEVHDPEQLLTDCEALHASIGQTRGKLKAVLSAALHGEN